MHRNNLLPLLARKKKTSRQDAHNHLCGTSSSGVRNSSLGLLIRGKGSLLSGGKARELILASPMGCVPHRTMCVYRMTVNYNATLISVGLKQIALQKCRK